MEKDQAVWCKTLGSHVSVSDSTFHFIVQFLVDGFASLRTFFIKDKLLQVGIKSFIGFTKQVHGSRRSVVDSRSNRQTTSFQIIITAIFSPQRNVKLRATFIHLVYFHAFKFCLKLVLLVKIVL